MELFSKKIRLIPAIFCIVLTLVLSYTLYASEYKYQINKEDLSSAISDFNSLNTIDAHVLETKKHDSDLIVSFKDNPNSGVYGIAKFIKGINQKYRIVETQVQKSVFSPVIQSYKVEINDKRYIVISAYNLTEEVSSYGVKYATYSEPGYLSNNMEA